MKLLFLFLLVYGAVACSNSDSTKSDYDYGYEDYSYENPFDYDDCCNSSDYPKYFEAEPEDPFCKEYVQISSLYPDRKCSEPKTIQETHQTACHYKNHPVLGDAIYLERALGGVTGWAPLIVNYSSEISLDGEYTLVIEAFDNPTFHGKPSANFRVNHFKMHAGLEKGYFIPFEGEGVFHLRTYAIASKPNLPGELEELEEIDGSVHGTFGALASPIVIAVGSTKNITCPEQNTSRLDRVFRNSQTDARVRMLVSLPEGHSVLPYQTTRVEFFKSSDFEQIPEYQFEFSSREFFNQSSLEEAEFLSPSLLPDDYFVRVYIDFNANGFYDRGEYFVTHEQEGLPKSVSIADRRTLYLALKMRQ